MKYIKEKKKMFRQGIPKEQQTRGHKIIVKAMRGIGFLFFFLHSFVCPLVASLGAEKTWERQALQKSGKTKTAHNTEQNKTKHNKAQKEYFGLLQISYSRTES